MYLIIKDPVFKPKSLKGGTKIVINSFTPMKIVERNVI